MIFTVGEPAVLRAAAREWEQMSVDLHTVSDDLDGIGNWTTYGTWTGTDATAAFGDLAQLSADAKFTGQAAHEVSLQLTAAADDIEAAAKRIENLLIANGIHFIIEAGLTFLVQAISIGMATAQRQNALGEATAVSDALKIAIRTLFSNNLIGVAAAQALGSITTSLTAPLVGNAVSLSSSNSPLTWGNVADVLGRSANLQLAGSAATIVNGRYVGATIGGQSAVAGATTAVMNAVSTATTTAVGGTFQLGQTAVDGFVGYLAGQGIAAAGQYITESLNPGVAVGQPVPGSELAELQSSGVLPVGGGEYTMPDGGAFPFFTSEDLNHLGENGAGTSTNMGGQQGSSVGGTYGGDDGGGIYELPIEGSGELTAGLDADGNPILTTGGGVSSTYTTVGASSASSLVLGAGAGAYAGFVSGAQTGNSSTGNSTTYPVPLVSHPELTGG